MNGVELEVYIAWECCLYVTNYPESYDKSAVEKLFSQVSSTRRDLDLCSPANLQFSFSTGRSLTSAGRANATRRLAVSVTFSSPTRYVIFIPTLLGSDGATHVEV